MFREHVDEDGVVTGKVILDDTPVELPTRLKVPQSRADQIRQFIRQEMSAQAAAQGHETFEEADDFEWEDSDHLTPYELALLDGAEMAIQQIREARAAPKAPAADAASKPADSAPAVDKGSEDA